MLITAGPTREPLDPVRYLTNHSSGKMGFALAEAACSAGAKVTLRSKRMYEFVDRLVNIALPRIKDFRGLSSKGIDKSGNYSFGVKEHIIFPEVSFDRADKVRGLDIIIVISAKNKEHSFALLEKLNFPFIKKGDN